MGGEAKNMYAETRREGLRGVSTSTDHSAPEIWGLSFPPSQGEPGQPACADHGGWLLTDPFTWDSDRLSAGNPLSGFPAPALALHHPQSTAPHPLHKSTWSGLVQTRGVLKSMLLVVAWSETIGILY